MAQAEAQAFSIITQLSIPTIIGPVCGESSSKYATSSIGVLREEEAGRCLLWATNGHTLAVVPTTIEDFGEDKPTSVPKSLGKPDKDGARDLRYGVGPNSSLFGTERVWVDTSAGHFVGECESGRRPPLSAVMPELDNSFVFVGLNAQLLHDLARAVNSPDGANGQSRVVLAFKRGKAGAIVVIGDLGAGALMGKGDASLEMDGPRYAEIRKRLADAEKLSPQPAEAEGEEE